MMGLTRMERRNARRIVSERFSQHYALNAVHANEMLMSPNYRKCNPCPYYQEGRYEVNRKCGLGVWKQVWSPYHADAWGEEPGYPCERVRQEFQSVCKGEDNEAQ